MSTIQINQTFVRFFAFNEEEGKTLPSGEQEVSSRETDELDFPEGTIYIRFYDLADSGEEINLSPRIFLPGAESQTESQIRGWVEFEGYIVAKMREAGCKWLILSNYRLFFPEEDDILPFDPPILREPEPQK